MAQNIRAGLLFIFQMVLCPAQANNFEGGKNQIKNEEGKDEVDGIASV